MPLHLVKVELVHLEVDSGLPVVVEDGVEVGVVDCQRLMDTTQPGGGGGCTAVRSPRDVRDDPKRKRRGPPGSLMHCS